MATVDPIIKALFFVWFFVLMAIWLLLMDVLGETTRKKSHGEGAPSTLQGCSAFCPGKLFIPRCLST
jgi:hypothetical protein